jgi:hypothetical protein
MGRVVVPSEGGSLAERLNGTPLPRMTEPDVTRPKTKARLVKSRALKTFFSGGGEINRLPGWPRSAAAILYPGPRLRFAAVARR